MTKIIKKLASLLLVSGLLISANVAQAEGIGFKPNPAIPIGIGSSATGIIGESAATSSLPTGSGTISAIPLIPIFGITTFVGAVTTIVGVVLGFVDGNAPEPAPNGNVPQ
ncbi:hypothetical protein GKC56_06450 [Neisseriaceae bacterium PsAf]|nr:hypothetical protein [Neisseriaceae bacterium PsAf]MCV2503462.1 hypothetical protein [Neisseriaceae bacterium]